MAKKRLNIKDKTGQPVDYYISAENVTIDGESGKPLTQKLDEIAETEAQAMRSITFNGQSYSRDNGSINIGEQEQPNWNESNPNYRTYIRNKPTLLSQFVNDCGFVTASQIPEGADLSTVFASVAYDPTTSRINFFGKGSNTVLAYLDAAPFIVDGMVENVTLDSSTNELVITFNTASGKSPIRVPLGSISGQGTVQSVKMNGGTPIQPVNGVIDLGTVITEHQSLSSYATKNYVEQAVQQAEQGETVVTSVDDVVLVDGFNSNTVLAGATARSVKELYDNVIALRNALAGIAFKDGLPAWQTVPQVTYSMDYTGLTNFAEPQTTSWVEGSEVTVELSAASGYVLNANVASAMTVTDMEDNALTLSQPPTFDSTGGTISFKIAHIDRNFKVTASAAQALAVTMKANSHLDLSPEGVISGETFSGTITPDNGYKLPTMIDGNNVSGSHGTVTYTRTSNTQGTITIANVTSALTINADAVELTPYTATIDDNNTGKVSGSNNNAPIEGQPWSTEISLNSSASEDDSITGITATMEGSGGQIVVSGNTVSTNSVTGNITITVTVTGVTRHNVTMGGDTTMYTHNAPSNGVVDGEDLVVVLTPALYCSIESIAITMGGNTLVEDTGYTVSDNNGVKTVTIYDVTENVEITVTATTTNSMFAGVKWDNLSYTPIIRAYNGTSSNGNTTVSPLIDIEEASSLTFNLGQTNGTDNVGVILYFDDKFNDYVGSRKLTNQTVASSGTGTITNAKSIRLQMPNDPEIIYGAWVKDGNNFLFKGEDYVDYDSANGTYTYNSNVRCSFEFLDCNYVPRTQADEGKKIFTGVVPVNANKNEISVSVVDNIASGYYNTGNQSYFITEWFDLVDGQDICTSVKMNCGESSQKCGLMVYKQNQDKTTSYNFARAYYDTDLGNNTFIKPINTDTTLADAYTKIALLCKVSGIEDCFLELSFDGGTTYNRVWSGASQSNEQQSE